MKKLTKEQRYIAYIIMLCELPDDEFFCLLMFWFDLIMHPQSLKKYFPELWSKRPEGASLDWRKSWFPDDTDEEGYKKRVAILKACILETHPDITKS